MALMIYIERIIVPYLLNHWTQNFLKFKQNLNAGSQVGNNFKRLRFQIKGLDNVKLSEYARFSLESVNVPILYDVNNDRKSIGQTIVRCQIWVLSIVLIVMEMVRLILFYLRVKHISVNNDLLILEINVNNSINSLINRINFN